MKYVDIKVTIWQRVHFEESADMNKVVETIITDGIDYIYDENDLGFCHSETLYDTEEQLTVAENGNQATVEVYGNNELIWQNQP
jgi:hypothetical protein